MSDLKAYLAANYMSGPKADAILARSGDPTSKKRKKKKKEEDYIGGGHIKGEGLVLRDEDELKRENDDDIDLDDPDAPVVGKGLATFQKSESKWNTVASSSSLRPSITTSTEAGPSSPPPYIKPDPDASPPPPVQITKRKGGLRTAAQLREDEEQAAAARSPSPEQEGRPDPTQTVHRDASGRIVDVKKLKEEEKRKAEEEKRKAREREEWTKGLVQRKAREERSKEEREMGERDVARYANDTRMNREMREVERWNDPAAEFLTKRKKKGPRRPTYKGPYGPNRFGIPPGYRWDGVDRGNGFEAKYFQYQNTAARRQVAADQMTEDV
ncbi:hypothetical protein TREMEDRAFT_68663 [Tremella mesenterica DSM 1558]|uniref:uncharacterized protein n=1 Tax=Tremella mesenterica (strain ATCC 24925 / CBS 8224 / DSM 1558 / NBRC 9311 / NRRL Y-6157 / RJB 2259-6 / UBC 559-6) TaxID=578456 RepID=UPI0003F4A364|nr:uncharacterized protein TREMEDRAFT_68663 [Tremella mesenterica DSM 1558]EIW69386.1 hypothetical protein TREMEDRAFT_68663 [Tremella mesenterica DSM 1558]